MHASSPQQLVESELGQKLLRECCVVVGMHPDEALDPIVDFSTKHNKPWVVVPCCVFRRRFTKRALPDGRPVCRLHMQVLWCTRTPVYSVARGSCASNEEG
jgi:hypothetical protein